LKAPRFAYARPASIAEAIALLDKHRDDARVLAGGQSLVPMLNFRVASPKVLVDINRIAALAGIKVTKTHVRIGALIAIEQSIHLQVAVESGIPVDCEATPEMLETIFFPNNAIHDGGVILKGDRIAFAACIFPLTQRQDLNKSLGTRHRAAIGLSEETDAVVVVVSEETGSISYAYKGQLVRGITSEELRAFLTSVFVTPAARSTFWSRLSSLRPKERPAPAPALLAKAEPPPAVPGASTSVAK